MMINSKLMIILPGTSGKTRVGLRVANFGSGACKDALTRSLSSTARRPSLRSLRLIDRIISFRMTFQIAHIMTIWLPSLGGCCQSRRVAQSVDQIGHFFNVPSQHRRSYQDRSMMSEFKRLWTQVNHAYTTDLVLQLCSGILSISLVALHLVLLSVTVINQWIQLEMIQSTPDTSMHERQLQQDGRYVHFEYYQKRTL